MKEIKSSIEWHKIKTTHSGLFDGQLDKKELPPVVFSADHNRPLYEKMARLRNKYPVLNGALEADITQLILGEIAQGMRDKIT